MTPLKRVHDIFHTIYEYTYIKYIFTSIPQSYQSHIDNYMDVVIWTSHRSQHRPPPWYTYIHMYVCMCTCLLVTSILSAISFDMNQMWIVFIDQMQPRIDRSGGWNLFYFRDISMLYCCHEMPTSNVYFWNTWCFSLGQRWVWARYMI